LDDLHTIRRNLARLAESAEWFLDRLPEIQRRNEWRDRNKRFLANPKTATRARRVLDQQTKVINEYYERFRRFAGNVHRTIQSLKGTIPTDEFVNLIREVDPSRLGYRISATCQVVQRAKQLVEELYRCRDLPRAVDQLHTLLREICKLGIRLTQVAPICWGLVFALFRVG
jgi:hypothetical protein